MSSIFGGGPDSAMPEGDTGTAPGVPTVTPGAAPPVEVLLAYGSPLHSKILGRLNARLDLSYRKINQRYDAWDRVDEKLRMFVDLSRNAKKGDGTSDPTKKEMPFQRAIVVPASYAIKEVRCTQMLSLFAYRNPMIQLEGRSPEDVTPAKILEAVLAYDQQQTGMILTLYSMLQDAERYGLGVLYDVWDEEYGHQTVPPPQPTGDPNVDVPAQIAYSANPNHRKYGIVREFNRWTSVDPYSFFPDPRAPVSDPQNGEFIGHRIYRGHLHLLEKSKQPDSGYFNIDKIKQAAGATRMGAGGSATTGKSLQRSRFAMDDFNMKDIADESDKGFHAIDNVQVKLVPQDWGLGDDDTPQIWWFAVVDETVIVRAHQSVYDHGKFTYSVGEVNPDQHALFNPGMTENLDGLQRFMDWMLNSHLENVIKSMNNSAIYAPSLIEEGDLLNPGPGKHTRLSKLGEQLLLSGRLQIGQMLQQMAFQDVTGGNLKTLEVLFDMGQRMSAANDPQMGQPTETKRTLGEIQSMIAAASQRVSVTARLLDAMAIAPTVSRAVSNRQQFTSLEQYFRVTGDLAKMDEGGGLQRLLVSRDKLAGDFDYIAHDGTLPADPARAAETWTQILEACIKYPQLSMPGPDGKALDVREVFAETVRAAGVKNIEQFYKPVQVMPNPQVQAGVQAGNFIPPEQAGPPGQPVPGAGIQTPMVAVPQNYPAPQ